MCEIQKLAQGWLTGLSKIIELLPVRTITEEEYEKWVINEYHKAINEIQPGKSGQ